jgi:hypothetical protein
MEGNLPIKSGDTVKAGYDFTMPGNHAAGTVTVCGGTVKVFEDCGAITISLPTQTYSVAQNENDWVPSGDQSSPRVYQGSNKATCTGHAPTGATFTANFSDNTSTSKCDTVNVRFHYSDNTSGSWSGTVTAISPQKCASPPCNCK